MKQLLYISIFVSAFCLFSCENEVENIPCGGSNTNDGNDENDENGGETEQEITSVWDTSYVALAGLKGQPVKITDVQYERYEPDGEWIQALAYTKTFDEKGNLTCYDKFTGFDTQLMWLPIDANIYRYEYNELGQLVKAEIETPNVSTTTYTLVYGEHELYVPLPFELGELDFVLVKGLSSVVMSSDSNLGTEDIILTCNGTSNVKILVPEVMGFFEVQKRQEYTYSDSQLYPDKFKEEYLAEDGTVLDVTTVDYTFSEDGRLVRKEYMKDYSGESGEPEGTSYTSKITEYRDNDIMSPEVETVHTVDPYIGDTEYELRYTYNNKGLLSGIHKYDNGVEDEDNMESYSYVTFDEMDNWTEAMFFYNEIINPEHYQGDFKTQRIIEYK